MPKARVATDQRAILDRLTKQYQAAAEKSCGGTIEMAETIVHAGRELTGASHTAFYEVIGIDPNGSKTRKFKRIGEAATRFKPHLDRLPNAWTTLYLLSKLEVDEFPADRGFRCFASARDVARAGGGGRT